MQICFEIYDPHRSKDMGLKLLRYIYIIIFESKSVDYMIKKLVKTHSKNNFRTEDIKTIFANYLERCGHLLKNCFIPQVENYTI